MNDVIRIKVKVGDGPVKMFRGRFAQTLALLIENGPAGLSSLESPGVRLSHYVFRLRRDGVIFYIGDHDPAGVLIDVALERELRQHLDPGINLDFRRIGITPEQIAEFDLRTKPRKSGDRRSLHIARTVEAEAMPAGDMRRILRSEIEELLPPRALQIARAAELSERDHLLALANVAGRRA